MLAFESLLVAAAQDAGMKTPPDDQLDVRPEGEQLWSKDDYPHFYIFCTLQLARPMLSPNEHWDNAKVIANIMPERLKRMELNDFIEAGVMGI